MQEPQLGFDREFVSVEEWRIVAAWEPHELTMWCLLGRAGSGSGQA